MVGQRELGVSNIDMKTGNQTFESATYHPPPTTQMTNLIQENLTGAARALQVKFIFEVHTENSHITSMAFRFRSAYLGD